MWRLAIGVGAGVITAGLAVLFHDRATSQRICVVCKKNFDDDAVQTKCQSKHKIHKKCLIALEKEGLRFCPVCRTEFLK